MLNGNQTFHSLKSLLKICGETFAIKSKAESTKLLTGNNIKHNPYLYFCCASHFNSSIMSEFPTLEKLGLLEKSHVKIKEPARVEKLISSIVAGSWQQLQVIADYDMTISRFTLNGKRCETSFGILDNSPLMPPTYREEANKLFRKYYPIEIDPNLTEGQKIPSMIEWYGNIRQLLTSCQLTQPAIKQMVVESSCCLREGTQKLFKQLEVESVPLLVFSAGMGDVLEEVLRRFGVYTKNIKVVSNFFKYGEEGYMEAFQGDLIHMFNKNENAIHSSDYFEVLQGRTNVLLMGDSLGDTKMAEGVPQPNNVLKIGFLNDKIDERLASFEDAYDVVLLDDQTMDLANGIVGLIETNQMDNTKRSSAK